VDDKDEAYRSHRSGKYSEILPSAQGIFLSRMLTK
jgi:hypothetical protein